MDHRGNWPKFARRLYYQSNSEKKSALLIALTLSMSLSSLSAQADVTPRLEVAQYYNDNVSLSAAGMEESANITELKPGISMIHDGRRIDAQLEYTLQALYFSGDENITENYHDALASTNVTLFPQRFFLDAAATYSQQFITPDDVIDLDNLSNIGNRTDVVTYLISPYGTERFGNVATVEYRFQYQEVKYKNPTSITETDSATNTTIVDVASGPAFDELQWNFILSRNKYTADDIDDSLLQKAVLETRYQIGSKFEALADVGYEDNDFEQFDNSDGPTGGIWSAGLGWSPSRRTHLEVKIGERFFGKTPSLLWSHRTRRSTWNLEYSKDITTTTELRNELDNDDASLPIVARTLSVILLERISFSTQYQTGKSILDLTIYTDNRDYQDVGQDEETVGGEASWEWKFLPRTLSRLSGTWYRLNYLGSERVDHLAQGEFSIERQIRRSVIGSIGYRVLGRNSTDAANEYDRKLAFVSLSMQF